MQSRRLFSKASSALLAGWNFTNDAPPASHAADVSVAFDARSMVATGYVRATVPTSIAALALAVDPQRWSESSFFPETYVLRHAGQQFERDAAPPQPGTSWRAPLFEHFCLTVGGVEMCRFKNILNIDQQVGQNSLRLGYSLHRPLAGTVWCSPASLGLDVDCGHLAARETTSGVQLELVKSVRFVALGAGAHARGGAFYANLVNRWSPVMLAHWLREATAPWLTGRPD